MSTWKHSLLASYYREIKGECQVRIDGKKIVVSYEQHDGPTVYEGEEVASGHFRLTCARKGGRATLHQMPGENLIESSLPVNQCRARPSTQNRSGLQKITNAPILPQQSGSRILRRKVASEDKTTA